MEDVLPPPVLGALVAAPPQVDLVVNYDVPRAPTGEHVVVAGLRATLPMGVSQRREMSH